VVAVRIASSVRSDPIVQDAALRTNVGFDVCRLTADVGRYAALELDDRDQRLLVVRNIR
jgi:hypothetical protein